MTTPNYKLIDINEIKYGDPCKNNEYYLSKSVIDNKNITFTTPKLKCLSKEIFEDKLIFEFEFNRNQWLFYQFISGLDKHNIESIYENCESWFKKKFPISVIDDFYVSNLKLRNNHTVPILKLVVDKNIKIKDNLSNITNIQDLYEGSVIMLNLNYLGLKFLKQQVLCEWSCNEIIIYSSMNNQNLKNDHIKDDIEVVKSSNINFKKIDKEKDKDLQELESILAELSYSKKKNDQENIEKLKNKINNLLY